jgi:hypothetical protein
MEIEEKLRRAVESQYDGTASFSYSIPVKELYDGEVVWDVAVHCFDLVDNLDALGAYAWVVEGRAEPFAVLHIPPIDSPTNAVRAVIDAEHQGKPQPP